jgi:hypothetical protein
MRHWGFIYILPVLEISVQYSLPTITLSWWIFRLDIELYYHLSDWFMKYVWGFLHLDFIDWFKKKDDEDD